jgi:hypothetical protein
VPDKKSILLIHPPLAKPGEPPAGIARLAGVLKAGGVDCRIYDANLEGISDLLRPPVSKSIHTPIHVPDYKTDTWSKRALKNLEENLRALSSWQTYASVDRYKRAVMDVGRVLHIAGQAAGVNLSLSDYADPLFSPVRVNDLLGAAEHFEKNLFYESFKNRLNAMFLESEPGIIGFSVNFMSQALCAFAMAGFVRSRLPAVQIIFGGGLVTSWMHIPGFENPFKGLVDDLVCGPGEDFLLNICGEDKKSGSAGMYDFSPFEMDQYLSPARVIPFSTSRGCYWRKCAFCPEKYEHSRYQPLNAGYAVELVTTAAKEARAGLIHFTDNALSPKFLRHAISHPPGASWYGFARITPHLADPDFAHALKQSGCVMLKLGVESGDQQVLDALDKGVDLQTISAALQSLKQAGIATYVYLLFGTPAEDAARAERTLSFTKQHASDIDFLNLAIFNLPAYSREAEALDTTEFYSGDLSLYKDFIHPKGWTRDKVRRFLAKSFKKEPAVSAILANDPPFFTSNHAPFLIMAKH